MRDDQIWTYRLWGGLAAFTVVASFIPFVIYHWSENHFSWGEWGTWLQGALVPGILIFAVLLLRHGGEVQQEANRLHAHALFMGHWQAYEAHLNYACTAAVLCNRLPANQVPSENLEGVARLLEALKAKRADEMYSQQKLQSKTYAEILDGAELRIARRDIERIVALAEQAGVVFVLDRRIIELRDKLRSVPEAPVH
jgi:hypothetical protein